MSRTVFDARVLILPMHPGHQYHFCRVGLPTYFLGNWDQFKYWRPKLGNVHNIFPQFEEAHLRYQPQDYDRLLNERVFADDSLQMDAAWLIFGWQYELFKKRPLHAFYHASKHDEINRATWASMLENERFKVVSYYPNTAEWVKQQFGVDIPYVPIGLPTEQYRAENIQPKEKRLLTVIHSWHERGWHYHQYVQACSDLPCLHIDHFNPSQHKYSYEELTDAFRTSQVYLHDGEQEYTVTLIEAMMAGMPIVSFDLPGIDRYVKHGHNGFVGKNTKEIREFSRMLLDDAELAARMGAESRKMAVRDYSEERWRSDWLNIIGGHLQLPLS